MTVPIVLAFAKYGEYPSRKYHMKSGNILFELKTRNANLFGLTNNSCLLFSGNIIFRL